MLETERKYLLKEIPELLKNDESLTIYQIYQVYLENNDRLRTKQNIKTKEFKFYYTSKTSIPNSLSEVEIELELTQNQYENYLRDNAEYIFKTNRCIEKIRIEVPYENDNNLKWEFDKFITPLGLSIVEIEIPDENYNVIIPDWLKPYIIMDVTNFKQFKNYNLCLQ